MSSLACAMKGIRGERVALTGVSVSAVLRDLLAEQGAFEAAGAQREIVDCLMRTMHAESPELLCERARLVDMLLAPRQRGAAA